MTLRLNGSTSGYTEIDAPAVAGSNTLVLPTGNGSNGQVLSTNGSGALSWVDRFSAAGPAFSAYGGSSQTLTNGVFTKLQFNTEEFDTASCFDSATNYRFTPNVAGYYQFTTCMNINSSSTGVSLTTFYKNGTEFKRGSQIANNGQNLQPNSTALIYLNGTSDYVEAFGYQNSGVNQSTAQGQSQVYFQAFLARPA